MDLHDRMCPGMVIDQDGAESDCKYSHDELICSECYGTFCDHHFYKPKGKCLDCLGEVVGKEDY